MTRVRDALLGAAAGIALAAGSAAPALADLPVVDTAALGEWAQQLGNEAKAYGLQLQQYAGEVKAWATQNLQWLKQVQQYATQLQQYASEVAMLEGWVHTPSLGGVMGLLNMAGLGNSLPLNAYAVMGLVGGRSFGAGGLPEISGVLSSLSSLTAGAYSANHVYTPTDASWASRELVSNANSIAGEQGAAQAAYGDLQSHAAALQALRDHLTGASSPKDVQDAQAQIALEQVWTTNEAAQLAAVNSAYAAQRDAMVQRDNEKLAQDLETFAPSSHSSP
ncbi:MAG TPA: type IV secretion system protein [Stellaceae bacterium]|nr:type IV secretion system protein [Stellaceae bacterium]